MISDLKYLVPEKWLPWLVAGVLLVWIGWKTSEVYSVVHQHYTETTGIRHITLEMCKAVKTMAKQDKGDCEEPEPFRQ